METIVEDFTKEDIELAIAYADFAQFEAHRDDHGEVTFTRSPLPKEMSEAMAEEVEFVADYFQRTIFGRELDSDDPDPKIPDFDDPIEEMNFKLDFYKGEFATEIRKSLGVSEIRQMNPFARAMLLHSAEVLKGQKKD